MEHKETTEEQVISKTVTIAAPAHKVWAALTEPEVMNKWMAETKLDITTDWTVGGPILIKGSIYKKPFENKGTVLAFEPEKRLSYNHLASISRLADKAENYTVLDFSLAPADGHTRLTISLHNFPTEVIYKHLAFYWNVTAEVLKKLVEREEM